METIRIVTDISQHVICGGLMAMSQEAPQYILEHEGLETIIAGAEMICLRCGEEFARRSKWKHQTNNQCGGAAGVCDQPAPAKYVRKSLAHHTARTC